MLRDLPPYEYPPRWIPPDMVFIALSLICSKIKIFAIKKCVFCSSFIF